MFGYVGDGLLTMDSRNFSFYFWRCLVGIFGEGGGFLVGYVTAELLENLPETPERNY
jgi:hypothetical protein